MGRIIALIVSLASLGFSQPPPPGVYRIGGGVTAPQVIQRDDAAFTPEALKAGIHGTVILFLVVQPDGTATNIRVSRPLGFGLDENAMDTVRRWRFRPGTKNGQPVPVQATIEVNFRLPQQNTRDTQTRPPTPEEPPGIELRAGDWGITTTIEIDLPLKPDERLALKLPMGTLSDQALAALDRLSGNPRRFTENVLGCVTAESVSRDYLIPTFSDPSCQRSITIASSTRRAMRTVCEFPESTRTLSVDFQLNGVDGFVSTRQFQFTENGVTMKGTITKTGKRTGDCSN